MANKNFEVKHGLSVGGTERITAAGAGSLTNLTLSGNLTVNGTTVTLDASTLQVADKNIVLNYHASNDTSSAANGAGITIQDAVDGSNDATLTWNTSLDKFDLSHGLHIGDSAAIGTTTTPALQIGGTTTYRLGLYTSAEGGVIENKNGDDGLQFKVKTAGEAMRIDGGTGNVGIGETSPQAGLELASTAKGIFTSGNVYPFPTGNAYIKVKGTNAEHNWIGITGGYEQSSGSANLILQSNFRLVGEQAGNYIGSEAQSVTTADITFGKLVGGSSTSANATKSEFMRIDSSGNVGIGVNPSTHSSTYKGLQIGSVGSIFSHASATGDGSTFFGSNIYNNSGWKYITTNEASFIQQKNGEFYFARAASGSAGAAATLSYPFIIDSSGNVGIGTSDPKVELDVYGDLSGIAVGRPWGNDAYESSGYFGKLANNGDWGAGSAFMKIEDSLSAGVRKGTNIDFVTHNYGGGNQTTMTLSADGNVGIGTTSPGYRLDIVGPGTSNGVTLNLTDTASSANSRHLLLTRGSNTAIVGVAGSQAYDPLWISRSGGYDLMVASSGNVGIGASTPTLGKLQVHGGGGSGVATLHLQPDTSSQFNHSINSFNSNLTNGENNLFVLGKEGSTKNSAWIGYKWYSAGSDSNCLTFGHWGNNNILNLNGQGVFMAGGLQTAPTYPGAITTARTGNAGSTTQATWGVNSTASGSAIDFGFKTSGSGSFAVGVINHGETTWMSRLDYSGAIHLTNTTVQNISDRRLKKDIVDANSQWNDIKALQFKNYKWIDPERGSDTYLGLIADEVESVSPGLVGIDAISAETMPDDGIDPEYKNVKYSIVWMKAVKALQEAMAKIETLETKLEAAEARIATLEG